VASVYLGIRMCKDDPFNHIALYFSNYDQYHHQFRWLTFSFPATDDISHVTFVLCVFEWVPHMGRSQQTKYLRLYFNVLVFEANKLANSEQSYKGKVKTHKYINRQNQSTNGKLLKP
jgi:hypothetical protein